MIIDLDGHYERVNDAFCVMVGYTREQLIGLSRERITHPDDVASDSAALRAMVDGDATTHRGEKRYLHASGRVIWAQINVTLLREAGGRPLQFVSHVTDVTERRTFESRLAHMADHDPLTGLHNRHGFEHELARHTARVWRYGPLGSVLMLDLDHFKYFNDSQGHGAGDELLVRVAQGLRARLRDSDVVARLGGDEFAVLLPGGHEQETQIVAESLLQVVRDEAVPAVDDATPALIAAGRRVTVSVGIARFVDGQRLTVEEMLINADRAMYDAKDAGGDRWARYDSGRRTGPSTEKRKSAEDIDHALTHGNFDLLAQPVIALAGNGPAQYELLLRMRDRHACVIQPRSFLYTAERLGLSGEIDRWVTGQAIDMLMQQRALGRDLRFEVNLCGSSIGDEALLELIERRLRETGVPPDRLIFEVTETAAVAHAAHATTFARRLSELGCRFALDDFGAGFGSFYYLKRLSFDYVKIDGEFVSHCTRSITDRTMISAVVQIAQAMGKHTIAEFAADQETLDVLTNLGVDYAQGFYLGRPAQLSEHLAAHDALPPAPIR